MGKICGVGAIVAVLAGLAILAGYPVVGYLLVLFFVGGGGIWALRKSGAAERARLKALFPHEHRED